MEKLDPNLETQVWRRIAGQPQPDRSELRPLLLAAWEQALTFRHLTGLLSGKNRERMKALTERGLRSVDALKGIMALSGQSVGGLRPLPIPKDLARRLLEKSFRRCGQLLTEYTARTIDPAFGTVYQGLGDRERENIAVLAEIMGNMER